LAARTVGSKSLIDGLRAVHSLAPAFQAYWANECVPILRAGFRPPLVEGFEQFVQTGRVAETIHKQLEEELTAEKADPYDTHPALKERIAAAANLPAGEVSEEDPAASALLNDLPTLENQLLAALAGAETFAKLKPIQWNEVTVQVYLPQWLKLTKANAAGLSGLTPESLPTWAADLRAFGKRFCDLSGRKVADEEAEGLAGAVVGAALVVLLVNQGGKPDATPGKAVSVAMASTEIEPFMVMQSLATGKTTAHAWQRQCAELHLQGVDIGKAGTATI
jgi:hypothetical protein